MPGHPPKLNNIKTAAVSGYPVDDRAPREVEIKLYVPPLAIAMLQVHPLVATHALSQVRVARIDNRYLDTPDGLLAERPAWLCVCVAWAAAGFRL